MAGSSSADAFPSPGDDDPEAAPQEPPPEGEAAAESNDDARKDDMERARKRLLAPIGGLYALAQTVTETERDARRLVERTYERAADLATRRPSALPDTDEETRAWVFELLVETARQAPGEGTRFGEETADDKNSSDDDDGDRHFRRRAQERFLRRTLPSAFAALTSAQRLLLTLCDVEGLDTAAAAGVTGRPEREVHQQHARARADLRDALRRMAPPPERTFLEDDALPDSRLAEALRRMAKRDLTSPPPALRPAARRALSRPSQAPGASAPPGEATPDRPSRAPAPGNETWGKRSPSRLSRALAAALLIALAGGLGYLGTVFLDGTGTTSLAALSAENASGMTVRLRTQRPERAEQFVRDELGRRLRVPRIEGAQLRGVGLAEVAPDERVPVFRFRNAASGRPVTAYAYDYALLDRAEGHLQLSDTLRRRLREEGRVTIQEVGSQRVLLWRHRDDIFAAVTDRADSLQQRIAF